MLTLNSPSRYQTYRASLPSATFLSMVTRALTTHSYGSCSNNDCRLSQDCCGPCSPDLPRDRVGLRGYRGVGTVFADQSSPVNSSRRRSFGATRSLLMSCSAAHSPSVSAAQNAETCADEPTPVTGGLGQSTIKPDGRTSTPKGRWARCTCSPTTWSASAYVPSTSSQTVNAGSSGSTTQ